MLLVVLLNVVRYLVGGVIESFTIMEPMHRPMELYPEVFDNDFTSADFAMSFGYNYAMWLAVALGFHFMHPSITGGWLRRSCLAHAIMCMFFMSLAAVYMNHYQGEMRDFYFYSILDGPIVFSVVALANAWLYPWVMRRTLPEPYGSTR